MKESSSSLMMIWIMMDKMGPFIAKSFTGLKDSSSWIINDKWFLYKKRNTKTNLLQVRLQDRPNLHIQLWIDFQHRNHDLLTNVHLMIVWMDSIDPVPEKKRKKSIEIQKSIFCEINVKKKTKNTDHHQSNFSCCCFGQKSKRFFSS